MKRKKQIIPMVSVYIRKWPFDTTEDIFPEERLLEIDNSTNLKVKGQKFYAWKLLEYAMSEEFGLDLSNSGLKKDSNKWCSNKCEFSISHTGDFVAVAVSTHKVGIDIEECNEQRFNRLKTKIVHPKEQAIEGISLCKLWTDKEALFKKSNKRNFIPNKINTIGSNIYHQYLTLDEKKFSLSVATDLLQSVKINIID